MANLPTPEKTPETQRVLFLKALNFALEFGFIIALPLIGLGYLGKYLDNRQGTKFYVLIGILLAITISTVWLYRRLHSILKDLRNK
jgi:hypothetical protein